ncbi:MAG: PEP-CTERM sorting domain-containing protein [Armatimonadota bacterium]|nr:PEP-CTERM sorting domain-containing protein [Armatimonadota bacterium]
MTRLKQRMMLAVIALSASLLAVGGASATTWTEVGDAGDLPGTAQVITGSGPLTAIYGSIHEAGNADLYKIFVSDPANFSASTVNAATNFDTHLFLFRSDGTGVYANEDAGVPQSLLPAGHVYSPTTPGEYFLGIAAYTWDPVNADGVMFQEYPWNGVYAPYTSNPITGWTAQFGGLPVGYGDYRIDLTGAEFIYTAPPPPGPVPEPSTMALMGLGLAAFARRRRKS